MRSDRGMASPTGDGCGVPPHGEGAVVSAPVTAAERHKRMPARGHAASLVLGAARIEAEEADDWRQSSLADDCRAQALAPLSGEMIVHRAGEWSIAKSYEELQQLLTKELGGYPDVKVAGSDDWLAKLIRQGAEKANERFRRKVVPLVEGAAHQDHAIQLDLKGQHWTIRTLSRRERPYNTS